MMRTLIVNCSLDKRAKIEELETAIDKFSESTTVRFRDIGADYEVEKNIDAVVLSGSKARIVDSSHRAMFKDTADLIKHLNLPTLAICYGHQLLCWSFGCEVASLAEPVIDRFEQVRIIEADAIFTGLKERKTISLVESHYDYVRRDSLDSAEFTLLADSRSCEVEAVKHKRYPFYGVQFHPERISIEGQTAFEGHEIIGNFYKNVVKK